jgi:tetratricopeptide (TPR) repeat protein
MMIQFARNYAILGDTTKRQERAEDALKLLGGSAAENPNDPNYRIALSAAQNELGNILLAQGNLAAALKLFQDSVAIAERLAKADPDNAAWQGDLAISLDKVGDVLTAQGNIAEAAKSYGNSGIIRDRLAALDPGRPCLV